MLLKKSPSGYTRWNLIGSPGWLGTLWAMTTPSDGDDRTARPAEVALGLALVADVGVERLRAGHLHHVQLHEQDQVADQQGEREAPDLLVHVVAPTVVLAATFARRRARRASKRSPMVSVSGTSPSWRAAESLIRTSRASST